jgi:hypothetical protein
VPLKHAEQNAETPDESGSHGPTHWSSGAKVGASVGADVGYYRVQQNCKKIKAYKQRKKQYKTKKETIQNNIKQQ